MTEQTEIPEPTRWATYPNDQRRMVGQVYGPNTLGEMWQAVRCDYDPNSNRSHVGFDVYRPGDRP